MSPSNFKDSSPDKMLESNVNSAEVEGNFGTMVQQGNKSSIQKRLLKAEFTLPHLHVSWPQIHRRRRSSYVPKSQANELFNETRFYRPPRPYRTIAPRVSQIPRRPSISRSQIVEEPSFLDKSYSDYKEQDNFCFDQYQMNDTLWGESNLSVSDSQSPEVYVPVQNQENFESTTNDLETEIAVSTIAKTNYMESPPEEIETEIITTSVDPADWVVEEDKSEVAGKLIVGIDGKTILPLEEVDESFKDDFTKNFYQLWTRPRFSDYILVTGQHYFRVHKVVLGIQSSVFASIFDERQSDILQIPEFDVEVVHALLRYLYTGEVLKTNFMDLFSMSAKYDVTKLKLISEKLIMKNIEHCDEIEVFNLGQNFNSKALKLCAFDKIKKLFPETTLDEDLLNKPELLQRMVRASRTLIRKIQETEKAEKRFEELMKQCKKSD